MIWQHLGGDLVLERGIVQIYYTAIVVWSTPPLRRVRMKTFLIFLAISESAHQNEWENAHGGGIFKLFAYWTTLMQQNKDYKYSILAKIARAPHGILMGRFIWIPI